MMRSHGILVALVLMACDGSSAPAADCRVDALRSCQGSGGCDGDRRCQGDPPEWGRCECSVEPDDDDAPAPRLGGPCERDSDCDRPAICLTDDTSYLFGGAPPVGTCVADCSEDSDACNAFDGATCVRVSIAGEVDAAEAAGTDDGDGDAGVDAEEDREEDAGVDDSDDDDASRRPSSLCFESCTVGADANAKCHGRPDVACEALDDDAPEVGFCRPLCTVDDECQQGRTCRVAHGTCVEARASEQPSEHPGFGGACDPDADAPVCEGLCVELSDEYAVCSHRCAFGQPGDCAPLQSADPRGGCLFTAERGGLGDVGFCGQLCDCDADCSEPNALCDGFTDAELQRVFGRSGVCSPAELSIGERVSCE